MVGKIYGGGAVEEKSPVQLDEGGWRALECSEIVKKLKHRRSATLNISEFD